VRETGAAIWDAHATHVLVDALVQRHREGDLEEAQVAVDRLAALPTDPGSVPNETCLLRLRALLARAHGDEAAHRRLRDRYRARETSLGFEGQMQWADAMA
jgi:adenylate cyclase